MSDTPDTRTQLSRGAGMQGEVAAQKCYFLFLF